VPTNPEADANPGAQSAAGITLSKQALASTWRVRRRLVVASLLFCAAWISYIIYKDSSQSIIHQTALYVLSGYALTILSGYIGGAVVDDRNVMSNVIALSKKGGG